MDSWVVDASGFRIEDAEEFKKSLLYSTEGVASFLSKDSREKFAVTAPKGFGKTLLLMLKRLHLIDQGVGGRLLPEGEGLIDKFGSDHPNLSRQQVNFIRTSAAFWEQAWFLSLGIAIIRNLRRIETELPFPTSNIESDQVRRLVERPTQEQESATGLFATLLSWEPNQLSHLNDATRSISGILRQLHTQVSYFIDNVDEYFDAYLQHAYGGGYSVGEYDVGFWYESQVGLVRASRSINGLNRHIRVYCAIRSEAIDRISYSDPQAAQVRGACVSLKYSQEELKSILVKNILNSRTLAKPNDKDPFVRWVGTKSARLEHGTTGEIENLAEYILRHGLGSPRDVAAIGGRISNLPTESRDAQSIKREVNSVAAENARGYLADAVRHVPFVRPTLLFPLIRKNFLSREEASEIVDSYRASIRREATVQSAGDENVLTALYHMGLLGYVGRPVEKAGDTQVFLEPGARNLIELAPLPDAPHYVIHPALSDHIAADYHPRFVRNANRLNIIGRGRGWRSDADGYYVVSGDIVDFSAISGTGSEQPFLKFLRERFELICRGLAYGELYAADSFMLANQHPARLFDCLAALARELATSIYNRQIRMGAHYGVLTRESYGGVPFSGAAFRTASRIQSVGDTGRLLATAEFHDHVLRCDLKWKPEFTHAGQRNVAKLHEDPFNLELWSWDPATSRQSTDRVRRARRVIRRARGA